MWSNTGKGETTITDAPDRRPLLTGQPQFSESFSGCSPIKGCLYSHVEGRGDWKKIGSDFGGKAEINQGVQLQAGRAARARRHEGTLTLLCQKNSSDGRGRTDGRTTAALDNNAPFCFAPLTFHTTTRRRAKRNSDSRVV